MRKLFRLAGAEFNKIFYRPSIFILTAILIISLVLSFMLFKPTKNINKISFEGNTVASIYQDFTSSSGNEKTKGGIDASFNLVYTNVDKSYDSIANDDKRATLENKVLVLWKDVQQKLLEQQTEIYGHSSGDSLTASQKADLKELLGDIKANANNLMMYLAQLKGESLNFYFTTKQYDTIYKEVQNLYDNITLNDENFVSKSAFSRLSNSLRANIDLAKSREIVGKLEKIEINEDVYNELVNEYYVVAKDTLQNKYMKQIEDFYNDHLESKTEEDMTQINEYIAQYNSYSIMNKTLLDNKFQLLRIGNKSDTELKDLVGYTEVSKYALNEQDALYEYVLAKEDFDYNYLTSFNFNKASGSSSNAYDFAVYSMQILSIFIIVFTVFYACSSIAGDQSSGTMKMIAIRPYTRNKLFAGKFLACLMFGMMLMTIATIASFVVGGIMYGVPLTTALVVFNSQTVVTMSPVLLMVLYLLSVIINLVFYISLAMFICLIFKSNTLSVFLTSALYGLQIILNGVTGAVWLKYTPFGHFDLFKYFGNPQLGFLSMNILPDANFVVSAVVIGLLIVVMNSISHLIFKVRDIS